MTAKKMLILSTNPNQESVKNLVQIGRNKGHELVIIEPNYSYLILGDHLTYKDSLFAYFGQSKTPTPIAATDFDSLFSQIGDNRTGIAIIKYLQNLGVFTPQKAESIQLTNDKVCLFQKLADEKTKVAPTIVCESPNHFRWIVEKIGGFPAIARAKGLGDLLLVDEDQANATMETISRSKTKILLNKAIEETDIKALVIGGKIIAARLKTNVAKDTIWAPEKNMLFELDFVDQSTVLRAANITGLGISEIHLKKDRFNVTYVWDILPDIDLKAWESLGIDVYTLIIDYLASQAEAMKEEFDNLSDKERILNFVHNK
jgi:ribosomal protein S6--L-glutamate ligase